MKTIRDLTDTEVNLLRAEEQIEWEPHCVYSGAPIVLPKRIADRLSFDHRTGCFLVSGWQSGNGYANVKVNGRTHKVHRVVYRLLRGPIPADHVLDHKKERCPNRNCCNDVHLEPVTVRVNTFEGKAVLFR